ncbi:obscurin-like [Astyanax mexicanus]|uniref:Obscurin-like n=1 Tax=Astyanax mexicanus TaxID=7994 RepID=A0A8T2LVR4_ASTMX|nr:obscurin-like [Astyanax mexicanus]
MSIFLAVKSLNLHAFCSTAAPSETAAKAAAAFSNKDSYQREVKVSASQKATLSCEMSDMKTEVKVSASQKATLSCEVSDMKTEVKWYKDGKQLSSSRTVHMETKGMSRQLVLDSVEKKDAGEYTCEAGNEKLTFKILVTGIMHFIYCLFLLVFKD